LARLPSLGPVSCGKSRHLMSSSSSSASWRSIGAGRASYHIRDQEMDVPRNFMRMHVHSTIFVNRFIFVGAYMRGCLMNRG
jgi:hypothetical protein